MVDESERGMKNKVETLSIFLPRKIGRPVGRENQNKHKKGKEKNRIS